MTKRAAVERAREVTGHAPHPIVERYSPNGRSNRRVVHPTKKVHGQVARLERPLPPGEGWGEGPVKSTSSLATSLIIVSEERIERVLLSDETRRRNHVNLYLPLGSSSILAKVTSAANGSGTLLVHEETLAQLEHVRWQQPLTPTLSRRERAFEP